MKKRLVATTLAAVMTLTSAFGTTAFAAEKEPDTKETTAVKEDVKIAYSIPSMFTTFFAACWKGVEEQSAEYNWESTLLDPNNDIELQISQIKNQVTQGANAIVISPIDSEAVGTAINECSAAGVPVFCIDRRGSGEVVATLETDNVQVGRDMGNAILEDYKDQDINVLIIQGVLSDTPTLDRTAGVKEVLEAADNVTIVGEPSAGEYSNEAAMSTTKTYLQSQDVDVIFTCTDALVPGILSALDEAGYTGLVGEDKHIGVYSVDGAGETLDYIKSGKVDATFSQLPITLGTDVVKTINEYLNGNDVEEKIYYSGDVVSKKNIEELEASDSLWGYSVE
ncbi:MAG: sugar ABC transporter substrate-binding protein [Eubacteriales bacterium]|nr:sugar ABC transporter substrate-binding protein [Eubacteriales bacterium]